MLTPQTSRPLLHAVLFLSPDDEKDLQAHKTILTALRRQRHQSRPIQWHIVYCLLPLEYYAYSVGRAYEEDRAHGDILTRHAAQLLKGAFQPGPMVYCLAGTQGQALKVLSKRHPIELRLGDTGACRALKTRTHRRLHRTGRWFQRNCRAVRWPLLRSKWLTLQWLKA